MQRYFLNVVDGDDVALDPDGAEYNDLAAAKADAIAGAREMLAEQLMQGATLNGQRIEIRSAAGELLETVRFADVMKFRY